MANANLDKIADDLSNLSLMDAASLVTILKERWNVSDAPLMAAMPSMGGANQTEAVAAKTEFDVTLASAGDKKLEVIKVIREITSLPLKEAKELVESAPKSIKESVSKDEANKIKEKLEAVGAKVELK